MLASRRKRVRKVLGGLRPGGDFDRPHEAKIGFDAVLVDAPCTSAGTWRRNPEARWRLDEAELARLTKVQAHLLGLASELVRPGGRVIYVTCSLLDEEGAGQFDAFLARPGQLLSKSQLEEKLYAFDSEVESNTIEVHVSRLRKKLGNDVIDTERGLGYRLGVPCANR